MRHLSDITGDIAAGSRDVGALGFDRGDLARSIASRIARRGMNDRAGSTLTGVSLPERER